MKNDCTQKTLLLLAIMSTLIPLEETQAAGNTSTGSGKQLFSIPAQSLDDTLNTFASATDMQIGFTATQTQGLKSKGLNGTYTKEQALKKILEGTPLKYRVINANTITLEKSSADEIVLAAGDNIQTSPLPQYKKEHPNTLPTVTVTDDVAYDFTDPDSKNYVVPNSTTATKTDTPIMETPVSIQIVPKAILADKQSTTLPDAVNGHVSGVLGRTGGGYLYDNFILRGLAGSGFGDAYRNGLFNRQDIYDVSNIEQVEILKGPAAVLYGRIEPGGLVNYVTKKPRDTKYYSIQQQFGSYNQYRTLVDATGPIDKNKTLLYRINGSYTNNESFRDFVGNERFFVAPSLTWRPSEKFQANLDLEYKHDRFNADYGIPAIDGRPAPIPITRNLKDGDQRQLMESTLVGFDWTYRFNEDWKITQRYLFKDWTLSGPLLFSCCLQADNRLLDRFASKGRQDVVTHSGNIDLNGKFEIFGTKHNLLIGFDGFHATTEAPGADDAAPSIDIFEPVYGQINFNAFTTQNSFFYRRESWLGVYFQDQIRLFDRLHVLLGGRYDSVTTGANFTPDSLEAAKSGREARSDDAFSPRAGLLYQVRDWLSLYGSYTESFSGNNGLSATGQRFDPQQGKQYEVGIKTETRDKLFSSTLAFFHLTKSNLLTDDPNEANSNFQILAGKIRSKGIELDLAGQVTDQLHLLATYAYTQVNYIEDFSGLQGNRLENVPKHQGSLWGTWQFNEAFKAGLGVVTVGMRPGDSTNTFILPGYARVDAMVAYTQRIGQHKLIAQLNINNLLDKKYYANSDGSNTSGIPGSPINVMGSLKYEF